MMATWQSHDGHMAVTWWSHGGHMAVTWWSHGGHMVVTWWSHGGHIMLENSQQKDRILFRNVVHITCILIVSTCIVAHLSIEEEAPQFVWHPNVEVEDDNATKHSKHTCKR